MADFTWASEPRGLRGQNCRVLVRKGSELVETLVVAAKSVYVFGRHSDCDFQLEHPSLSRKHAALVHDGAEDKIYLVDLGSAQGTFIGNSPSGIVRARTLLLLSLASAPRRRPIESYTRFTHCEVRVSHAGAKYARRAIGGRYIFVCGFN